VFTLISQSIVIVLSRCWPTPSSSRSGEVARPVPDPAPWTAPISLGTIGWLWMFDSIFSPIDWVLRYLGLLGTASSLLGPNTNLYWLGVPGLAMASVILVNVWRILPLATVIQLGGLSSIPGTSSRPPRWTAPPRGGARG